MLAARESVVELDRTVFYPLGAVVRIRSKGKRNRRVTLAFAAGSG